MTGFKFTDDQRSALKLIGGMVRNLLRRKIPADIGINVCRIILFSNQYSIT